jgi:phosphoribosyl-dephospho-CoA transferase
MTAPARHDLVWLDPARLGELSLDAPHRGELARWLASGWPLVATRRPPGLPTAVACLGLPLPPSRGRNRIALRGPTEAILRVAPPLRLAEALSSAPATWHGALRSLDAQARSAGFELRVHGSLAWQHLTGEPHLTPTSDLDLLLAVNDRVQLEAALELLGRWERPAGVAADVELTLPQGGVAWRELASGASRLLVKGADFVALRPRADVIGSLRSGAAA